MVVELDSLGGKIVFLFPWPSLPIVIVAASVLFRSIWGLFLFGCRKCRLFTVPYVAVIICPASDSD